MSVKNGGFSCPEHEASLQALLFGELEGADKEALEHHLRICTRCRLALEDARLGLRALSSLEEDPLPYSEHEAAGEQSQSDIVWVDFQKRLRLHEAVGSSTSWRSTYRVVAAAALVIVGFTAGRWLTPRLDSVSTELPAESVAQGSGADTLRVEARAVEALARAELLSDVGLSYVVGLQDLLNEVMQYSVGNISYGDLAISRERARELIRDGRLLRRTLDATRDQMFLTTINRAEVFLEELAVLEIDTNNADVRIVQASLSRSGLHDQISALDVENEVALALEASGWIGEEIVERKEF